MPTRADLGRWVRHFITQNYPPPGQGDHIVSEALYLRDPDGHGIEVYRDRPREGWVWENGRVRMGGGPVDVRGMIAEANAAGIPMVLLAGRTGFNQRGRGAVQDLAQLEAVAPITKWRAECPSPERIPFFVAESVHQARSGAPGVAYVDGGTEEYARLTPSSIRDLVTEGLEQAGRR